MSQLQIVDGLTLKSAVRYLPYRFPALAIGQLTPFRLSNQYKAKWHTVPESANEPIPAYEHVFYQVWVPPGSFLWAFNFNTVSGTGASSLHVQVKEACNDVGLFRQLINAQALQTNPTTGSVRNPIFLTEPRPLIEPGCLDIDIANSSNEPITCQLLLMFFVPSELFGRFYADQQRY